MPEQTQIFHGAVDAAPNDYTLADNVEFLLYAVNANFTDNGAAGDWLPAVVLLSDSGHVIARALLPDVRVTAGDDAEVSWFPGVKPGAGGSATGGEFASVYATAPQTVPAGEVDAIEWDWTTFRTTDAAAFSPDPANQRLDVTATGVLQHWISVLPDTKFVLDLQGVGASRGNVQSGISGATAYGFDLGPPVYVDQVQGYNFIISDGSWPTLSTFYNFDGTDVILGLRLMVIALQVPKPAGSLSTWPVF